MSVLMYSKRALKFLLTLPEAQERKIREKVQQYADEPDSLKNQVKKLQGCDYFRLRVDNYRVIFDKEGSILLVLEIGHRKNIYR